MGQVRGARELAASDSLVGTLAARGGSEVVRGQGLAGKGVVGDVGDEVHVEGPQDGDPRESRRCHGGQWLIKDRWPGDCLDEMAFETRQSYLMIRDGRRQLSRESRIQDETKHEAWTLIRTGQLTR